MKNNKDTCQGKIFFEKWHFNLLNKSKFSIKYRVLAQALGWILGVRVYRGFCKSDILYYRKTPQTRPRTILVQNHLPQIFSRKQAAKASWKNSLKNYSIPKSHFLLFYLGGFSQCFCNFFPKPYLSENFLDLDCPEHVGGDFRYFFKIFS